MLTLTRYAVHEDNSGDTQPLREVAVWVRPMDPSDPRIVQIDGHDGDWVLQTCREPLVDMLSQLTPATMNRFNELVDAGGQLRPGGTLDIYRLPLLDGYRIVTEDEYVDAWNAVCAPEQRIA